MGDVPTTLKHTVLLSKVMQYPHMRTCKISSARKSQLLWCQGILNRLCPNAQLRVIQVDQVRKAAQMKVLSRAQKEQDTFRTDSKVDKEAKTTDIEHKTAKKQDESQALTVWKSDLEGIQKELDAALAYFDKLKPSCVDAGVSYEDRVARREEEIKSLQDALRILNGEDLA